MGLWLLAALAEGVPFWRVLCHADSTEPQGLELTGEGEVVARVLAHKAGVDIEEQV